MKNIPKDFLINVVENTTLDKGVVRISSNGKPLVIVDFFDWRFSNQNHVKGRAAYLTRYRNCNICSDSSAIKLVTKKINNSGFRVKLTPHRYYGSPLLELIHPEFDNLSYQPSITCYSLFECLSKSGGYLNNWEFPGTYKLGIVSLGYNQKYELISESGEDSYTEFSIKIGEVLSYKIKKSSNLEPGYFYCLNNRDLFLCLGKVDKPKVYKSFPKSKSTVSTPDLLFESLGYYETVESSIESGYLIIPIRNTEIRDYLKFFIGKTVTLYELISNIPYNIAEPLIFHRWLCMGCINKVPASKVLEERINIETLTQEDILETSKSAVLSMIKNKKISFNDDTFSAFAYFAKETINVDKDLFNKMLGILGSRYGGVVKYVYNNFLYENYSYSTFVDMIVGDYCQAIDLLNSKKVPSYYSNKLEELGKFTKGYQSIRPLEKKDLLEIFKD